MHTGDHNFAEIFLYLVNIKSSTIEIYEDKTKGRMLRIENIHQLICKLIYVNFIDNDKSDLI